MSTSVYKKLCYWTKNKIFVTTLISSKSLKRLKKVSKKACTKHQRQYIYISKNCVATNSDGFNRVQTERLHQFPLKYITTWPSIQDIIIFFHSSTRTSMACLK